MKKLLGVVLLSLTISGCATMEAIKEPRDYNSVYSRVKLSQDSYIGTRSYIAPTVDLIPVKFGVSGFMVGTLDLVKKGTAEQYCITTIYQNKDWAFFDKAYDKNQNLLQVKNINRRTSTMFNEVYVLEEDCIEVNRKYLESSIQDNGIDLKLVGKNRAVTFQIPGYYIKGFLDAVDYSEKIRFTPQ